MKAENCISDKHKIEKMNQIDANRLKRNASGQFDKQEQDEFEDKVI
jgi:hypothetical protein